MKLSITGHRPEDLPNPEWVETSIVEVLQLLNPSEVIQGCAAGVDLMVAIQAIKLHIPVISARPWAGHTPRVSDKAIYQHVLNNSTVKNVDSSEDYPGVWVYHNRNKYMIDNSDTLLAVWTGKTSGGTYSAVRYASKTTKNNPRKPIYQINPLTMEKGWFIHPEETTTLF